MSSEPTVPSSDRTPFGPDVLEFDLAAETDRLTRWIQQTTVRQLRRRGLVVAVSGGIDSAVCASLAARAIGPERITALFLPETATPTDAAERVTELCADLGLELTTIDIGPTLASLGCYRRLDDAVRTVFPDHPDGGRCKIVTAGDLVAADRAALFDVVAEAPDGGTRRARMPLDTYLEIVATTNMKQRTRKLLEYTEAERRNFGVVGTPNRAEFEQGFFVRGGDGLADLKPIAHLYKVQVYALAKHLGVPESIQAEGPSTDTYSLPQSQEEFFYALPYEHLDLLLWARAHRVPEDEIAAHFGWTPDQVRWVLRDIEGKARMAERLHRAAVRPT